MKLVVGRLIFAACLPSFLLASTVSLQSSVSTPTIGQTFTVDVNISGSVDLYGFQFDLMFDPTVLAAVSVAEGDFLPNGGSTFFIPGIIGNTSGTVANTADSLLGAIPGEDGDGTLAEFQFTALAAGTSPISFANEILLDSSLNDITANSTFQNGSITVGGTSSVPEPQGATLLCAGLLILASGFFRIQFKNRSAGVKARLSQTALDSIGKVELTRHAINQKQTDDCESKPRSRAQGKEEYGEFSH